MLELLYMTSAVHAEDLQSCEDAQTAEGEIVAVICRYLYIVCKLQWESKKYK